MIPKELRPYLDNKTELREALGPDRRTAIARHATALAGLQARIAVAEKKAQIAQGKAVTPGRYPLPVDQIALRDYNERLALDDAFRNAGPTWASIGIDDLHVGLLRDGLAGKLNDVALERLIGERIERYRLLGNTTAVYGSDEWRALARILCMTELEYLARVAERDEGIFNGRPENPVLAAAAEADVIAAEVSTSEFNSLTFEQVIQEKERLTGMGLGGRKKSTETLKKYRNAVHDFEHAYRRTAEEVASNWISTKARLSRRAFPLFL